MHHNYGYTEDSFSNMYLLICIYCFVHDNYITTVPRAQTYPEVKPDTSKLVSKLEKTIHENFLQNRINKI